MKRFLIICDTAWCGTQETYAAYAPSEWDNDLMAAADLAAFDNFCESEGPLYVLEELFPDTDDYTDEQLDEAADVEESYYSVIIEEYYGTDEDFEDYKLILDKREK